MSERKKIDEIVQRFVSHGSDITHMNHEDFEDLVEEINHLRTENDKLRKAKELSDKIGGGFSVALMELERKNEVSRFEDDDILSQEREDEIRRNDLAMQNLDPRTWEPAEADRHDLLHELDRLRRILTPCPLCKGEGAVGAVVVNGQTIPNYTCLTCSGRGTRDAILENLRLELENVRRLQARVKELERQDG